MSNAWIRELAEAHVNVDFELDFDLKDRADRLAETYLGKVMVGTSGRDIIYKTLREGAIMFKERELMRTAQEARDAADAEAPRPNAYTVWGTQGQGGSDQPDETFPTLEQALTFVRTHKDDGSWGIKYPDGTWHDWSNEPKDPTVCSICGAPADLLAACCGHVMPHVYVCPKPECLNKHYDVCPENNRADKRFRLKSVEVKEYHAGKCVVCDTLTSWACSDCAIDTGGTVYVCNKTKCRDIHEETCTMKGV